MDQRNRTPQQARAEAQAFAARFLTWRRLHGVLLDAVCALRNAGDVEAAIVLLSLGDLRRLRLSWELWAALMSGDGFDADELLDSVIPADVLASVRWALWATPTPEIATALGK